MGPDAKQIEVLWRSISLHHHHHQVKSWFIPSVEWTFEPLLDCLWAPTKAFGVMYSQLKMNNFQVYLLSLPKTMWGFPHFQSIACIACIQLPDHIWSYKQLVFFAVIHSLWDENTGIPDSVMCRFKNNIIVEILTVCKLYMLDGRDRRWETEVYCTTQAPTAVALAKHMVTGWLS